MIAQPDLKFRQFALAFTVLCMFAACSSQPRPHSSTRYPANSKPQPVAHTVQSVGQLAASVALQQLGVPYRYGGATRSGFDCSGLVQYSYDRAGKRLPRTTGQLWSATKAVDRDDIREGDLLFFRIEGKMSHVGLYVGNNRFVHAPSSGRVVSTEDLRSPFYAQAFLRAGRPD